MKSVSQRIVEGMAIRNMKQVDIIEKTGINKGALSSYISEKYEPKQTNIYKIAKALDVNEAWLMGYDVPMERNLSTQTYNGGGLMNALMENPDSFLYQDIKNKRLTKGINFESIDINLLKLFKSLNDNGKNEALKRIRELSYIPDYTNAGEVELNAAHEIEGATESDKLHDDDLMNDDKNWE